jgi:hypothetical protein
LSKIPIAPAYGHVDRLTRVYDLSDPWVSAVVELRAGPEEAAGQTGDPHAVMAQAVGMLEGVNLDPAPGPGGGQGPSEVGVSPHENPVARAKSYFMSAGFEVHAPLRTSFSIAGRRSLFETFFGDRLVVDEEVLGGSVTTEAGGSELALDRLPEEIRALVEKVSFPPSPQLPPIAT